MSFHATAGIQDRFITEIVTGGDSSIDGRFSVIFSSATEPAVAVFQSVGGGKIHGTFLTTTGDYRYLAGRFDDGRLRLSCFDGAHAFLFDARMQTDGTLRGDFWSRDTWHETWVASPDAQASVADGFTATSVNPQVRLDTLRYVDLDGAARSPADPIFDGPAKLLVVFGTWCPNCGDATRYLVQLHQRYAGRGLSIVALAFEMTGNLERDIRQVRTYARYHGIEYPVLVAGTSDKALASAAFPLVDRVRAYPTILFIDGKGLVRGVYSGFSGPATGPAHERMKRDFEERIERLLAERPAGA
jgi:thiol-disulfide isomerase/thioredoxin